MNTVVIIWFAAPESIPEVIEATRAEDLKHLLVNALSIYAAQDGDCSDQLSSISNVITQILEKGSKCDLPLPFRVLEYACRWTTQVPKWQETGLTSSC